DGLMLSPRRYQGDTQAGLLPAEDRLSARGMQLEPRQITVGVMQADPEQAAKGENHHVDQTVLVVDSADQYDHQQQQQPHAGSGRHDEDASVIEHHLTGRRNAAPQPALEQGTGLTGETTDQIAGTSISSRWATAPPPWPAGSSLARNR